MPVGDILDSMSQLPKKKRCLTCKETILTEYEIQKNGGICFFCETITQLDLRKSVQGTAGLEPPELPDPIVFQRDPAEVQDFLFDNTQQEASVTEVEQAETNSTEQIKQVVSGKVPETTPTPQLLTGRRRYTVEERKRIYEEYGYDPEAVYIDPVTIVAMGSSPEVKLELTLPRVAKNDKGQSFEGEFQEIINRTLRFIIHMNDFGTQHPDTLPQLQAFLGQKGNPDQFPPS